VFVEINLPVYTVFFPQNHVNHFPDFIIEKRLMPFIFVLLKQKEDWRK